MTAVTLKPLKARISRHHGGHVALKRANSETPATMTSSQEDAASQDAPQDGISNNGHPDESTAGDAPMLVVEDNPVMVAIIGKILTRMECPFDVAADGAAAVDACGKSDYSIVLMDINMPGMNGMEATRKIRGLSAHYSAAPIIAVTANLDPEDIARYKTAGMTDCVKKPVNQIDLGRVIAAFLAPDEDPRKISARKFRKNALQLDQLGEDDLDALNWETLREYGGVMKEEFPRLLRSYLMAAPGVMDALSDAVFGEDAKALEFQAHKLKSTSIVFGAESVSHLAAQLEQCGRGGDMEAAKALFNELHICFERTNAVLKKKLTLMRLEM